ncbi:hypothetical protein [Roseibium sp. RKSG952]|uniref:hypothetical protein n=1 Tax=Roseibium sp. RKSG952 TaxID=2529384 RepID=UPI0012BD155E|nr:hypothetical protein [Roseibium sp. RKSG952]MTH99601.1 hypothetical protein [Roseibium sp. RKSG952]
MRQSGQKTFFTDFLEGGPSLMFFVVWRLTGEMEAAGLSASALALIVFLLLRVLKAPLHPVMLGVNLHILLIAPALSVLFRFGGPLGSAAGGVLLPFAQSGVLVSVLLTGIVLTVIRPSGFAGLGGLSKRMSLTYSVLMLCIAATGAVWAVFYADQAFAPVAITLAALFVLRRYLVARQKDHVSAASLAVPSTIAMRVISSGTPQK